MPGESAGNRVYVERVRPHTHIMIRASLAIGVLLLSCGKTAPRGGAPGPDGAMIPIDASTADGGETSPDGGAVERDAGVPLTDGGTAPADAGVVASDAGLPVLDGGPPAGACPENVICIETLPYRDERDTRQARRRSFDRYDCAPSTNEGGAEFVYRVSVSTTRFLTALVTDGAGVDIDVHLLNRLPLGAENPVTGCLGRGDRFVGREVTAGSYFIVADTFVNASGVDQPGPYTLEVGAVPLPVIDCAMRQETLEMFWGTLDLPATGQVVLEAHLVTTAESFPGNGWPTSGSDGIERHYALSQSATGFVALRNQGWAPFGEGGSQWGQGSSTRPAPEHEGWYINMYWRRRPAQGTRMIVRKPGSALAVVAAAGYETGPGSSTAIAGVAEEIHRFFGTTHRDTLTVGFAVDGTLPIGPARCR